MENCAAVMTFIVTSVIKNLKLERQNSLGPFKAAIE
jgi:hypothetical protein